MPKSNKEVQMHLSYTDMFLGRCLLVLSVAVMVVVVLAHGYGQKRYYDNREKQVS